MPNNGNNWFIEFFSGVQGKIVLIAVMIACMIISVVSIYAATAIRTAADEPASPAINPETESAPETTANIEPDTTTDTESESEAQTTAETTPDTTAEIIPDTTVETTAETTVETTIETTVETTAETTVETTVVTTAETIPETTAASENKIIICLDPGHGYDDPGTDSDYLGELSEKDITLDIALRAADYINTTVKSDIPVEVYLTRTNDIIPDGAALNEYDQYLFGPKLREAYIESLGEVSAVVSIHCDYYEQDSSLDGTRIFYSLNVNKKSVTLGLDIADHIAAKVGATAGGRLPDVQYTFYDDAYYMTKCTPFPAVLVECGFVTNETEANNMLDENWRQSMASSIAEGIITFLGL